jgi:hypothetical protein
MVEHQRPEGARSNASPELLARVPGRVGLARAHRLKAKVITIDLDQVEGPHEDALVIPSVSDAIER